MYHLRELSHGQYFNQDERKRYSQNEMPMVVDHTSFGMTISDDILRGVGGDGRVRSSPVDSDDLSLITSGTFSGADALWGIAGAGTASGSTILSVAFSTLARGSVCACLGWSEPWRCGSL